MQKKKKLLIIFGTVAFVIILLIILLPIGGLSGTYASDSGREIEFISGSECIWYERGHFFEGTYEKEGNIYILHIYGDGAATNTVFTAIKNGNDLIVDGGYVNEEVFYKQ